MHGHVEDVEHLTPHLVRVVLGGPGLDGFVPDPHTDSYVNIALPVPGAPYEMPCDLAATRDLPREQRPYRRRYTVRSWDAARRRLTVDFVVHGPTGVAGPWATTARPGDVLQLEGPSGGYRPDPDVDWHLMVGDESALPAIAASLESVAPGTVVHVLLEVEGDDDHVELSSAGDVHLTWLHRDGSEADRLGPAVVDLAFPPGRVHGFVHGEAAMVREVRRHLLEQRGVAREHLSASPCWRRGMDDEAWRTVKQQRLAEQDAGERTRASV